MRRSLSAIFAFIVFAALLAPFSVSKAQSVPATGPRLMVTWKAHTYAPPFYTGKVLPTANTLIDAAVSVIDGEKVVDLSGTTIYWYANGDFIGGGRGVQKVSFRAPNTINTAIDLRAQLQDYKGNLYLKTITVPVVPAKAVIGAPYPRRTVLSSPFRVYAYPFFFNVPFATGLGMSWEVNGNEPTNTETPDALDVTITEGFPPGAPMSVRLVARNPGSIFETAVQEISLRLRQ